MRAKLDAERIIEACQECGVGFCIACGAEHDGVDPDARGDECEECGLAKVYGAEECLIMGLACTHDGYDRDGDEPDEVEPALTMRDFQ